ncbi:DUF6326 family protein [Aquimarina sp. 2201CG5-10]|uniref:DUF6326 family protein n=1 Tax=Aquimarina callyspongiae TaxID=3098150 RepID=UPI002AB531BB|nr:DUF6326 family protein [Aquimarina sp. 2201CG5-10]MDY8138011.1 DUF6326 family protein [Aquimarina sp. 2201CG5-10]
MKATRSLFQTTNIKARLSALWIFVLFNMLYADCISLLDHNAPIHMMLMDKIEVPQEFLLAAAILMETGIIMIFLSRVLKHKANRWTNIIVSIINIIAVIIGGWSSYYYLFFATMEILAMLLIIWYAWNWKEQKSLNPV